ncbi:CocE/NonD family hydrolase [Streptomyces sp. DB-54]
MPTDQTQNQALAATMRIDWDVPIEMDDGVVLRADVFRPAAPGRYPVILSHGVYGKGLPIERFRHQLNHLADALPENVQVADVADAFSPDATDDIAPDDYRVWETVDPAAWVPDGYVCVRVDARGAGSSPGRLDPLSPRETRDYAACIEWAGTQHWSNGRVGLCGKSYYAMTQWLVAALRPPHLAAMCVWHGESDFYRDAARHGGIMYEFWEKFWYPSLVLPMQHGRGPQAGLNPHSGRPIAGEETADEAVLAAARADIVGDIRRHPFDDDYYRDRAARLESIEVPVLASADWSDHDLHLRGTIRGFQEVSSTGKWLEVHAGGQFDDPAAVDLQRRFFDHHLKDRDNGWQHRPRVELAVRRPDGTTTAHHADRWPLPDTQWRSYHLDLDQALLDVDAPIAPARASYQAGGPGIALHTAPMLHDTTLAGPMAATLWLSSSTIDADLFLVVDAIGPDGRRVELRDHRGGLTPVTVGWLRASHRAIDPARSTPWQPYHTHQFAQPLVPGEIYRVDVELRPTAIELPAGHRLRLIVRGHGAAHNDSADRPVETFDNTVTLHSGPDTPARLLVPDVPKAARH